MDNGKIYVVVSFWTGECGNGYDIELTTTDLEKAKSKMREVWDNQVNDEYNGIDFSDEEAGWDKCEDELSLNYWNRYDSREFMVSVHEHEIIR